MISDKIPTLEAIKTLAKRIKVYIDNIHIFKNHITIAQEEDDSTYSFITSNTLEYVDNNTNSLLIEFSPSNNKININNAILTNLAEPLEDSDAATKQYVDNSISTVSAGSVINLRCIFENGRQTPVSIFSTRVTTFTDLKNSYNAGELIKIHVIASVPDYDELHFVADCDLTNYNSYGNCFYIPIIYTTVNSNDLKSIMLRISAASDLNDAVVATLLFDRILNNEITNNEL